MWQIVKSFKGDENTVMDCTFIYLIFLRDAYVNRIYVWKDCRNRPDMNTDMMAVAEQTNSISGTVGYKQLINIRAKQKVQLRDTCSGSAQKTKKINWNSSLSNLVLMLDESAQWK